MSQYFDTVPGTPLGVFERSGIDRQCGKAALGEYARNKSVRVALDDPSPEI